MITALLSDLKLSISFQICLLFSGSTPEDGSSIKMISGSPKAAHAIDVLLLVPPERFLVY